MHGYFYDNKCINNFYLMVTRLNCEYYFRITECLVHRFSTWMATATCECLRPSGDSEDPEKIRGH